MPSLKNTSITIGSFGGLCNKIKNIISGIILAEQHNLPLKIIWHKSKWIRVNYEDLFEAPKLSFIDTDLVDDILSIKNPYRSSLYIDNMNYNFKFNSIPDQTKTQIKEICNLFKPKKYLSDQINYYAEKFDIINSVGVHYRYDPEWTHFHKHIKKNIKIDENVYYKEFINAMSRYTEKQTFFLSSARNEECIRLKNTNNRLNINSISKKKSHKIFLDRDLEIMYESIIDLFLLSRCKELIITPKSTFSEVAWMIGGCNKKVLDPVTKKYV